MNICLFVPLGFLIPYCTRRGLIFTVFTGLLLSATIEAIQYYYCLGYCEFDDVFNNTVGSIIGFAYWKLLVWEECNYGPQLREYICDKVRAIRDKILLLKRRSK